MASSYDDVEVWGAKHQSLFDVISLTLLVCICFYIALVLSCILHNPRKVETPNRRMVRFVTNTATATV